ncbi:hypothetical protein IQ272_00895 [Chroococcidiopsidales cyanobacterium LEGE 13417]|nr:hypothetical protein [Chroococcidiopsidales cyanobacterium LEGE 13417]
MYEDTDSSLITILIKFNVILSDRANSVTCYQRSVTSDLLPAIGDQ